MNLEGKTAVVIGSAHGIGKGAALALAKRGVRLLLADNDSKAVVATAGEVEAMGGHATAIACDVLEQDAFTRLEAKATEVFGAAPDLVINNVGVLSCGEPLDIPLEEWQRILDINLMSMVRSVHAFLPAMLARGNGHFANTASIEGLFSFAFDRLPYAASKAAVVSFSEGLALYLRPRGIGLTCLCPGPVITNIGATMRSFTPDLPIRGPGDGFEFKTAEEVGELFVQGIEANRILITSDDQTWASLQSMAADPNAWIERQITEIMNI